MNELNAREGNAELRDVGKQNTGTHKNRGTWNDLTRRSIFHRIKRDTGEGEGCNEGKQIGI